jgi:aspartate/methionine/tyrosine aminotransferase
MTHYLKQSLKNRSLQKYIQKAQNDYKKAAGITIQGIKEYIDMPCLTPEGGLYTLMKINEDGNKFVERVLKATGVLFIPGNGFGDTLRKGIRISYGPLVRTTEKISEGLKRVGTYIHKQK